MRDYPVVAEAFGKVESPVERGLGNPADGWTVEQIASNEREWAERRNLQLLQVLSNLMKET